MIRLGVIGCGGIATHQLNSVWEDQLFKLVAGADIRSGQLDIFREKFGMEQGYEDYRQLLAAGGLDAVMVCTPTYLHAEMVMAAAAARLPIFCQKPMAMTSYDCYRMLQAAETYGVGLQIGFVRRFDTDWGTLKKVVDGGELGRPLVWRQTAGGACPERPFFMERMEGGGPMIDGMVHNYDFACHCFGRPVEVKSMPTRLRTDTTALDTGTVLVRFEHGDSIMVSWSWGLPKGTHALSGTDMLGPNGVLYFPGSYPASKVEGKVDRDTEGAYVLSLRDGVEKVITFKRQNMFREEMRHFAAWVGKGERPLVQGDAGLHATRIAELALSGGGLA